jgi:hypothetical protein
MAEKPINYRINIDQGRRSGADDLRRVRNEADGLEKDLQQATRASNRLESSLNNVGRGADFGRTGGGLERVLSSAVGGGSQELLGLAGDIGDVIEGLAGDPQGLKGALKGLISPAGLMSAGLAAAGVAMSLVTAETERQKKAAQDYLAYVVGAAQTEERLLQQLRDGGTAAIEAVAQAQSDQLAIISAGAQAAKAIIDTEQAYIDSVPLLQRGLNTAVDQATERRNAAQKAYDEANKAAADFVPAVEALNIVMGSAAFRAAEAAEGFETLSKFLDSGRSTVSNIADLVTGALDNIGDMAQETADAAQEAFDKLQGEVQSAVDKLDADGTKLSDALRNTVADLNAELVSAQQDAAADIVEARADAAAAELEAVTTFQRDQARAQRDFEREQQRIRDDARRSELDAIEANDIQALLNVREESQAQLKENRQRFKAEQSDRQADFEARRAAEQAALAETITSIIAQRDAEIASINARIVAERASFDAQIAEIERLKAANIAQIDAVIAANERKHTAEIAAIDAAANRWEQLVMYQNGQLYQINPALKNSPATAGSVLAVPPPPVDPFGIGNFFNPPPAGGREDALSVPPVSINMPPGAIIVGDLASKADVFQSVYDAIRAAAAALYQARTGVSA